MPDFSFDSLQSFLTSWRSAITWLFQCIVGVFDVIKSSPLYYMPLLLICIIGIVGGIALLIFDVSDRAYMQENYSPLKPFGIKGWYHSRPWLSLSISSFKRRVSHDTKTTEQSQKAFSAVSASSKKYKPIRSDSVKKASVRKYSNSYKNRAYPANSKREKSILIDYED